MFAIPGNTISSTTTSHKVVLPFYLYASFAFLTATIFLVINTNDITKHYFHPYTLAITHTMSLGWGTMIILGAAHQLVPVMIEGRLYSNKLAYASFVLAALGIPLLVFGFYTFNMGLLTKCGGELIVAAIIAFLVNMGISMAKSKHENVHAFFVFTASLWLLVTATVGLLLVYNFSHRFLPVDSIEYLSLHAHMGIVGWFLLLVTGVGSRLIPMFLISKYSNSRLLWWVYALINGGLLSFVFIFLYAGAKWLFILPLLAVASAIILFGHYCLQAYKQRIRKKVDEQVKVSLLAVLMMLLPLIFLVIIIIFMMMRPAENIQLVIAYGFIIFFGWITAIILGMTFKTLPFIIWNKAYHQLAGKIKTPNPKDLFNHGVFKWMGISFISGFTLFIVGILFQWTVVLQLAAILLLLTAFLYNWNVVKLFLHKPVSS